MSQSDQDSFAESARSEFDEELSEVSGGSRRKWLVGLASVAVLSVPGFFTAQHFLTPDVDPNLKTPELNSAAATVDPSVSEFEGIPEGAVTRLITQEMVDNAEHPLDPLIKIAEIAHQRMSETVEDYTACLDSQVRYKGELGDERHLEVKIRHEKTDGPDIRQFSVYTHFLKPKANAGQEAIWVKGWHKDNIVAHGNGLLNVKRVYLDPDGAMAMKGNRNPIYDIGIKNLLVQLLAKAKRDRQRDECKVEVIRRANVAGRQCTLIKVTHPTEREYFDFHIANVYIDDERGFPIAYEGYIWPETAGGEPRLLERFIYSNIELNVGLKDFDFSADNPDYNYPAW